VQDSDQCSEIRVVRDLEDFQNRCTIEDSDSDIYEPLPRSSDDVMASPNQRVLPMISEDTHQPSTLTVTPTISAKGRQSLGTVDPGRFYQSPSTQRQHGKKKTVQGVMKSPGICVDHDERDEIAIVDNAPK
jgi:hypothetical protein